MRIHFNGLAYFGSQLVNDLNAFSKEHQFHFYDTYASKIDLLKYTAMLFQADKVVSFNGVSSSSGSLDLVLKKKKPLIMFWHGTDVLKALEAKKNGKFIDKYTSYARHFTDSVWLKEELRSIGISAELLPFKYVNDSYDHILYDNLDVLSYLGEGREEFYGYNEIFEAAKNLPNCRFTIVGSNGEGLEKTNNISFLGWADEKEMIELRASHPIFLRCSKHDGNALSVLEALAAGQEVIWTYPGARCHHYSTDLTNKINEVRALIESRKNTPNLKNRDWVKKNHGKETVLTNFIEAIVG